MFAKVSLKVYVKVFEVSERKNFTFLLFSD